MLETPIPKLVSKLSVPTVLTMLITVIYNTADTYFVSKINKSAAAGVGVVFALMAFIQAVGYGLGMGAGALSSLALGDKRGDDADKFSSSAFIASAGFGILVLAVGLPLLTPIMRLLGSSDTILPYSVSYAKYILIGAPVFCANFVLNNTLRAEGNVKMAMMGTCAGGIINVGLDPLFVFTLNLGTGGAALATMICNTITFFILAATFLSGKTIIKISIKKVSKRFKDYLLVLTTGLPTVCRQGLGSVATAALNIQAVKYGDAAVAAITVAGKIYIFVRNFVIGIGQGFQPVAGYNYGAGDTERTRQSFYFATVLGTVVCVVFAVLTGVLRQYIMGWFSSDAEVVKIGSEAMAYGASVMPLMAFSTYVNQLYQCLGFKLGATFLACCRQGIFFLPVVLILPSFIGLTGVCLSQPIADLLTDLISLPFVIYFIKKHLKKPSDKGKEFQF